MSVVWASTGWGCGWVGEARVHLFSVRRACLCELFQAGSEDSPSWADNWAGFNKNVCNTSCGPLSP